MGALLVQLIAFLAVGLLVWKIAVPEIRASLDSPFRSNAQVRIRKRKYLVGYVSVRVAASVVGALGAYISAGSPPSRSSPTSLVSIALVVLSWIILLTWALEFFSSGRSGLFRELYLTNTTVQETAKPFFWYLLAMMAAVSVACFPFAIYKMRELATPKSWLVCLADKVVSNFLYLALIFNLAVRGYGVLRTLLNVIGVSLLVGIVSQVLGALQSLAGVPTMMSIMFRMRASNANPAAIQQAMTEGFPVDVANVVIAAILIGAFLYRRFNTANPGVWVPVADR